MNRPCPPVVAGYVDHAVTACGPINRSVDAAFGNPNVRIVGYVAGYVDEGFTTGLDFAGAYALLRDGVKVVVHRGALCPLQLAGRSSTVMSRFSALAARCSVVRVAPTPPASSRAIAAWLVPIRCARSR